jgi:hypothetical protein
VSRYEGRARISREDRNGVGIVGAIAFAMVLIAVLAAYVWVPTILKARP